MTAFGRVWLDGPVPVRCPLAIRNLTREEFDDRDRVVMKCAYASQNKLGRFCDEKVYENDLVLRLRAEGMRNVHSQIPVTVSYNDFEKIYRLDLVAEDALYELKTVAELAPAHDAQAFHYAMLAGINHAKLLNFRTAKVQGCLRFNALTSEARRQMLWEDSGWQTLSLRCGMLRERMQNLLEDWGGCLESRLYEDALVHFCGGEANVSRRIPVFRDSTELGTHLVNQHQEDLCFVVTAFPDGLAQSIHLERLLAVMQLKGIQWFNLNRTVVECRTLVRP